MNRIELFTLSLCLCIFSSFAQDSIVLQPGPQDGKDAMVQTLYPATNMGSEDNFIAAAWTYNGVFGITRSLVQFDLSVIPPNATVSEAKMDLYYNPNSGHEGHSGSNASYIRRITTGWEEYSITWNNQPNYTTTNEVQLPPSSSYNQDFLDIDVTQLVKDMLLSPEESFGFLVMLQVEDTYRSLIFSSSDHLVPSKWPKLVITFCEQPIAGFEYTLDNYCVHFTDTSTNATQWYWDFGDGNFSNWQHPVHCYSNHGEYNVCLISSNNCGADTVCEVVRLFFTSLEESSANNLIVVSPNPVQSFAKIILPDHIKKDCCVKIINAAGKMMMSQLILFSVPDKEYLLDLSNFNPGIYFLVADRNSGLMPVKFVVY